MLPTMFTDVVTVHHGRYYQDGEFPPADWDTPTPVPFLSASGSYLVAVLGPQDWAKAALKILAHALKLSGIGAKTSSGYGRLKMDIEPPVSPERLEMEAQIILVKALTRPEVAGSIYAYYERWRDLDLSPEEKRGLALAIVEKVQEAGREKRTKDKAWYKELLESFK